MVGIGSFSKRMCGLDKGRIVLSTATACILLAAVVRNILRFPRFFHDLICYIPLHFKYKNSKKAWKTSVISDYSCWCIC